MPGAMLVPIGLTQYATEDAQLLQRQCFSRDVVAYQVKLLSTP